GGLQAKLFEHALLEGLVTAAGRDAETYLGVVDTDRAGDFAHQLLRGSVGALDVGEKPAEDRCKPEADRDGQRVLTVRAADLRLKRERMHLLDKEADHLVGETLDRFVPAHELQGPGRVERVVAGERNVNPAPQARVHLALGNPHPRANVVLGYLALD